VFYSLSIAILFENSLEKVARLLLILNYILKGSHPPLGRQYSPFLEAPRLTSSIVCYNTQANAIKQPLNLSVTFDGNPTEDKCPCMHHKEGSKLNLQEKSACTHAFNIVKGLFATKF